METWKQLFHHLKKKKVTAHILQCNYVFLSLQQLSPLGKQHFSESLKVVCVFCERKQGVYST